MTSATAVLVAPADDDQEALRLWDGLESPSPAPAAPAAPARRGTEDALVARVVSDRPAAATLEALVAGAWELLAGGLAATCPVCEGALEPRWSAGAGVVGGRCASCGTGVT